MKASAILSEVVRDLTSGTARAALYGFLLAAIVAGLALVDQRAVASILDDARAFRAAGSAVSVLESRAAISGQRCAALEEVPGVTGAGAVRDGGTVTALALPAANLAVHEVTPGILDLLSNITTVTPGSDPIAAGVWLTDDLANTLGATPGATLALSTGDVPVTGVFTWPDDGRDRQFGFSVLAPVPAVGTFTGCMAEAWPADDLLPSLLQFTSAASGAETADQRMFQLNGTRGAVMDTEAQLSARPTRWAAATAAVAALGIGYVAARTRRLEIAAALHAKVSRPDIAWIHLLQVLAWTIAAGLITTALVTWNARAAFPTPWTTGWLIGLRVIGAAILTPAVGTLLGIIPTRESHLFRYFKNR